MKNERFAIQKYFDEFNPTDFDAKRWASVCRQAGMKYAVLTAKHHDGFCLFDSKLTEYKSTNTRFGRDIVREFLEAFRAEGIAVGLYFSLLDWSHPDFPKYADRHHPMRGREEYCGEQIDFDNYLNFMHGQVKELVTGYGKLDLLWFDFPMMIWRAKNGGLPTSFQWCVNISRMSALTTGLKVPAKNTEALQPPRRCRTAEIL